MILTGRKVFGGLNGKEEFILLRRAEGCALIVEGDEAVEVWEAVNVRSVWPAPVVLIPVFSKDLKS